MSLFEFCIRRPVFSTVLSLPFVLDQLVPELEKALPA